MFAPAPELKVLKKMNYISDQEGIIRRFLREQNGWQSHLSRTSSFILSVLEKHETNHIVVLGSGWLLDFPLEDILSLVQKIDLVDVYFPAQILKKAAKYSKVECIKADITGGYIQSVYDQLRNTDKVFKIPEIKPDNPIFPKQGKLVISLNILNQLDILLIDYICSKIVMETEQIQSLRQILQESHINLLQEHSFILISDYKELLINRRGDVLEEKELIFTRFPQGKIVEEWDWFFDSHQLYNSRGNTLMKVKAVYSKGS